MDVSWPLNLSWLKVCAAGQTSGCIGQDQLVYLVAVVIGVLVVAILARQSRAPPSMAFPITTTATASITRPTEHAPAQNTPLAQDYSLGERGSTPNLGLALDVEPGHRLVQDGRVAEERPGDRDPPALP